MYLETSLVVNQHRKYNYIVAIYIYIYDISASYILHHVLTITSVREKSYQRLYVPYNNYIRSPTHSAHTKWIII